jgi:hypothetical protein
MPPILFLSQRYVRRKPCTNLASSVALSPNGSTELPLQPRHLGVPSSLSKTIFMPLVCSVQTVLQPCTDTNIVPEWTKTRFHTTRITYEFHQVRPKLFMAYGTFGANRAPILCSTISKRNKQSSTRPSSP